MIAFTLGRVSPGLAILAAIQAVVGPSYRAARDGLERFFGYQVVSHETIRQLVLRIGEFLEEEEAKVLEEPEGKRRVGVLFLEADGYRVSMQREKDREVRMAVSHEGWQPRNPGSDEYELVNKSYYVEAEHQEEEFWEDASRHLYGIYEIDDKTMVVINGDQASWIRKGVEYFPKAIYQVDRYHLKSELRDILRDSRHLGKALAAVDVSDVGAMMESLREARLETTDPSRAARMDDLLSAMTEMLWQILSYHKLPFRARWLLTHNYLTDSGTKLLSLFLFIYATIFLTHSAPPFRVFFQTLKYRGACGPFSIVPGFLHTEQPTLCGPGINPHHLNKVFDRFFRGDPSRARSTGGWGLGLAIARSIVEASGGRIWAENIEGGGARFLFTLPRA